ncbi:MAG: 6-phospho-beta-glucosidase [Bacteroidales bacterium]|nr:6-phospho-beta-glucosidase [Bacteroidales bacterium]MCM1415790.1 6-phospho-beta-glucosidase [bacterium]MCM1422716.1 6-phospho-beta-glucosidase [bacterium]
MMMKLAIIGGGSSYTPELVEGVILHRASLPIEEIVLIDIPEGEEKVRINTAFAERMLKKAGHPASVRYTFDRTKGLSDAAFVITQLRVGGLDAREKDERIPLKYDMIGQETTGAGGFFKALRTIPVILDICRDMEKVCPDAWLINFTNPAGIVTEAVLKYTTVRCIGLCNVPINMRHDAAERLGVPADELDCRFIGLNHLSVMTHAFYQGTDLLREALLADNGESVVKNIEKNSGMDDMARTLGCMLSPYLQYFYFERTSLRHEKQEAIGLEGTRAVQVKKVEQDLFACYQDEQLNEKPEALAKRGGARYSEAAINLIDSIWHDRRDVQTVDTANRGTVSQLADNAVIETNCVIGKDGATPLALTAGNLPPVFLGLMAQVKAYESLTVEAAVEGDRNKALLALLHHPLVHEMTDTRAMMEELMEAHKAYLPAFFKEANGKCM